MKPQHQDKKAETQLLQAQEPDKALQDWRNSILRILLPIASVAIFPALVQTVVQAVNNPLVPWQGAVVIMFLYLSLLYVTINRNLGATERSWFFIMLTYLTGVISMTRGGLAGDGTIYLTVLPVLAITLINTRVGLYATGVSLGTFIVFGILAQYGVLDPWLVIHDNPRTADQWLYYGLVMGALVIIAVIVVARFADFQMQTLKSVKRLAKALEKTNQQLERKVQQRTEALIDANKHLHFLATHDNLTELPNRALFFDRLEQTLRKSRRARQSFALFFIDLDDFKIVNDTYGHVIGDQVLIAVSRFLVTAVRETDTVARMSGDEFVVIVDNVQNSSNVERVAQKTVKAASQFIDISGHTIQVTVSIGISIFPDHGEEVGILVQKADEAMYLVKERDKNNYRFYSDDDH